MIDELYNEETLITGDWSELELGGASDKIMRRRGWGGGEEGGEEAAWSEHGDPAQGVQQGPGHVAHRSHARGGAPLHLGLHLLSQVNRYIY